MQKIHLGNPLQCVEIQYRHLKDKRNEHVQTTRFGKLTFSPSGLMKKLLRCERDCQTSDSVASMWKRKSSKRSNL
jgi:hypothetical protein